LLLTVCVAAVAAEEAGAAAAATVATAVLARAVPFARAAEALASTLQVRAHCLLL
jgi:hypothetical protein